MIEPDFHYTVISGSGVVSVNPVTEGNGNATGNWLDITALSAGTAIIQITYDAIDIGGNTSYTGVYAASDPQRTGLVIIHVGPNGSAGIDLGMASTYSVSGIPYSTCWDAEYDTVYFSGASGVFSFMPSAAGVITDVAVLNNPASNGGWTALTASSGIYTAAITPGNNIIRVASGSGVNYQIVRGAQVTTDVSNTTYPGEPVHSGDTVSVSFTGLYMPMPKFSGIYNPGYTATGSGSGVTGHQITYTIPAGMTLLSTESSNQYDFRTKNGVTVSAAAAGTYKLTGGYIHFNMMGVANPVGGHRVLTDEGAGANFNAVSTLHARSVLPDVTLTVVTAETNAEQVADLINAIGTVTKDSAGVISAARAAYDALSDAEQTQVTNYDVLLAAETAFDKIKKESGPTPVFTLNITGTTATCKVDETVSPLRVTVSVEKPGTLSYQWYVKTGDTGAFTQITGAVSASYTPPATEKGTRYYKVVVTNTYESKLYTAESGVACIVVNAKASGKDITHTKSYYPTTGFSFNMNGSAVAGYVTVSFVDYGIRTSSAVDLATPLGVADLAHAGAVRVRRYHSNGHSAAAGRAGH